MKVILEQDIKGTGKRGQILEISDGYARNYLFPRKLAKEATPGNVNAQKTADSANVHKKQVEHDQALALAKKLNGSKVEIKVRAGENGRLFGAITSKEVAEAIERQIGLKVDKKKIEMPEHIKQLGDYPVKLRVYAETLASITLTISAQ
jgi:large subunit ribosomal protein L9